jgi:hypothetical protein
MNNNSELIDRYLQNEMNADERITFENQLAADKNLQEEFAIQQKIINAATTAGLRMEFRKAVKKRIFNQQMIRWGIIVVIAATIFIFFAVQNGLFTNHKTLTEINRIQAAEKFDINNTADTIIETKYGVVFAIPANAFNSSSNNIRLEIKTALNAHDIIQNGLSTMSNDALLQTAGMFSINGYENDKPVSLKKEIAVSVPARQVNRDMQLFDGVQDSDGHINWVNPKPVEKRLRTYDIGSLDFYPPRYIPALKALQKNYQDKRYTDSLYYSFSGFPYTRMPTKDEETQVKDTSGKRYADTSMKHLSNQLGLGDSATTYEIDPSRIRTIRDKKFNNTIIATKEFEERIRFIHSLCTSTYLDIYLGNLNKRLCDIDKLCADRSSGEIEKKFLEFAARKDGAVLIPDGLQQKLSNYFQEKYMIYKEATAKTWEKYESELLRLNSIADAKNREEELNSFTRKNKNFQEELCINLIDAYRQIGVKRSCNDSIPPPAANYYNVTISTTGWKNLDVYVFDATGARESMTYTDPNTGKTALLSYKEINMQVKNQEEYDRVLVYVIPDSLNSFQRVRQEGNNFKEKLNSLFRYDAVVFAYKGTETFFYRQQGLQPGNYVFSLSPVNKAALRTVLNDYSRPKTTGLSTEFEYRLFEQQEAIRQLQLLKDGEFREKVAASIFNCGSRK